jgi:hypothetical protein
VSEARRRAYLEAMGFDVWVARSAAPAADAQAAASFDAQSDAQVDTLADRQSGCIQVGPGRGSTLLVCSSAADSASKFAADVVRALGGDPAWAWPVRGVGRDHLTLEAAIGARLITRVLVFGGDTVRWLFQGAIPPVVGSATVTPLAGLGEISLHGADKRALWRCLQDPLRIVSPGGNGASAA